MQKIRPDELALDLGENRMRAKSVFHFVGARREFLEQIAVASLEVLKNFGQLDGGRFRIERQDPVDDMIRPGPIRGIKVPRFGCRLEGAHDHSRWIGPQIESLPVQERGLRQRALGSFE